MNWRRLRPGELDHELIWLGVSLAAGALALVWLELGLPTPACMFHAVTGMPCPTCGATRCVRLIYEGSIAEALRLNPLVAVMIGGVAAYDVYAVSVLGLRLPRLRWAAPAGMVTTVRVMALGALVLNWAWLIRSGV